MRGREKEDKASLVMGVEKQKHDETYVDRKPQMEPELHGGGLKKKIEIGSCMFHIYHREKSNPKLVRL